MFFFVFQIVNVVFDTRESRCVAISRGRHKFLHLLFLSLLLFLFFLPPFFLLLRFRRFVVMVMRMMPFLFVFMFLLLFLFLLFILLFLLHDVSDGGSGSRYGRRTQINFLKRREFGNNVKDKKGERGKNGKQEQRKANKNEQR